MDLWEYYERVERLIVSLRGVGAVDEADAVEVAIRGGATSGEILGRLSLAIRDVAKTAPSHRAEMRALSDWTDAALREADS